MKVLGLRGWLFLSNSLSRVPVVFGRHQRLKSRPASLVVSCFCGKLCLRLQRVCVVLCTQAARGLQRVDAGSIATCGLRYGYARLLATASAYVGSSAQRSTSA